VGSQVTGTIMALNADFNAIVRKGEVIARLDPSLYQSTLEQSRATLDKSQADLERLNVDLGDTEAKLQRARDLAGRKLIAATELEDAEVARRSSAAQVRSGEAQVALAKASVKQAQVNLEKTVITSPIDGIVISRSVDVGQTVSASLSAPTLYVLAADLRAMQLQASIDEADLGRIRSGQTVSFTVDAYPGQSFAGVVEQVRLNPVVESNVVTYTAIITAPNAKLELKPGMTANLLVEVARRDGAVKVPAAALRLRPTVEALKALDAPAAPQAPAGSVVLWQPQGTSIVPVVVRPGATDGQSTELLDPPFAEGAMVVTRLVTTGTAAAVTAAPAASSPLMPTSGPPRRQ
jgi:HlyD family secretion protein